MGAQITWLVLVFIGLLISANQDGKPKTGKYSFLGSLISITISLSILYWGGFFNVFFK